MFAFLDLLENILHVMIYYNAKLNENIWQCRAEYKTGPETLSEKLRSILVGIQTGCVGDKKSWTVRVD